MSDALDGLLRDLPNKVVEMEEFRNFKEQAKADLTPDKRCQRYVHRGITDGAGVILLHARLIYTTCKKYRFWKC